jgi:predicted nucleotidyltransferase
MILNGEMGDVMRTYEAIEKVSNAIIEDGICEAILIKGSIGRGDDDEYSDVDMYVVVKESDMERFLEKRLSYLNKYMEVIYSEKVNFVAEQIVAIYDNGLHFDLYTVTENTLPHKDKIKVVYDPNHKFDNYVGEVNRITADELAALFSDTLYYFVEADGAYERKNYPWAARILSSSIAGSAVLLRYLYDKDYAYLGLKKINEVIPEEQYMWLEEASNNLNKSGFQTATNYIIRILEYVSENIEDNIRSEFNYRFFNWVKNNLNTKLFAK